MNENAKKWVAALRGGEYQQAKGLLREIYADTGEPSFGYCCLGVATDLYAKEHGIEFSEVHSEDETLHLKVMQWLGLADSTGTFTGPQCKETLVSLNDDVAWENFDEIADVIESEPEGLFTR